MSIKEMVRESIQDLHDAGIIDDVTARNYAHLGVTVVPESYSAEQVARIRESAKMSQAAFSALLNVAKKTLQKWEQGQGTPNAPSRKLLELVDRKGAEALY